MFRVRLIFLAILCFNVEVKSQIFSSEDTGFSRGDYLRGTLSKLRNCYDVYHYNLSVDFDFSSKSIKGNNVISFKALRDIDTLQIDLFRGLTIDSIRLYGRNLKYFREFDAVFVLFENSLTQNSQHDLVVHYHGTPQTAIRAPWDGGFTWTKDQNEKDWVAVSCQGLGASSWWPCKDHQSEEPDSMSIHLIVPNHVKAISNGNLISVEKENAEKDRYNWFVSYPINSYNVSFYLGDYIHFSDVYRRDKIDDTLALDYYVLSYNKAVADSHFQQVKPMLQCFEKYFGPYPFQKDGYALVEAPYAGMEHQSAIAYGNQYQTGYWGKDYSGIGLNFDYIIIHETGHEWWGNLITSADLADLWIHEGFCTYSEALYVECMYSYDKALAYVNAKKKLVDNEEAIIGVYGVNDEGSGDMYNKGMLFLNTLRHVLNDDQLWFSLLKNITKEFAYKPCSTAELLAFMTAKTQYNFGPLFEQYLRYPKIPELQYSLNKQSKNVYQLTMQWKTDVHEFKMPVAYKIGTTDYKRVILGNEETTLVVKKKKKEKIQFNNLQMYFNITQL